MCSAFPHRRSEPDTYERDIVDMAIRYPGNGFYEYHKLFSLDSAAHLRYNNMAVDWSIRNNTLFCNIFTNIRPNTCNVCGSNFHTSGFCSLMQKSSRNKIDDSQDTYDEEVSLTTTTGISRTNTLPEAIPVNDEWIQQVEELWEACLCQSIKQAYMTGVKCFQNFMTWDDKFCGHSFRIGAATSAAAAGIEDHIIQTLGRMSSDCYMRYISCLNSINGTQGMIVDEIGTIYRLRSLRQLVITCELKVMAFGRFHCAGFDIHIFSEHCITLCAYQGLQT
ncbi:unnamed protein product [Mytilus coruscus]|uniref:Uncharacterized protein n=1 Tax=Mytilus coruscus TaxID=42192 RepID=A0A6J8EHE1_MYTCO|nr:unnamed protein product [Mytilus coruscus]